jgi:Tol biopolymer transport system component
MVGKGMGLVAAGAVLRIATSTGGLLTVRQSDTTTDALAPASIDVSANGRFVAFESRARLVPAVINDHRDIYVLDLVTRIVTLESNQPGAWIDNVRPRLSADGRFLAYESTPAARDGESYDAQIVWCDRVAGTSRVLTIAPDGRPANGPSRTPDISDDGQTVVFVSKATNLVAGDDANGRGDDVYAFDGRAGSLARVSVDTEGVQAATGISITPTISGDGRWIVFASSAPLAPEQRSRQPDDRRAEPRRIFARDLLDRRTVRVSQSGEGVAADRSSWGPVVNRDGRFVAFVSDARTPGRGSQYRASDVFLHDRKTGGTRLVSRAADGGDASGSSAAPSISADGRYVAFQSDAPNLVCSRRCTPADEDINLLWDVFVFDATSGTTTRISADGAGEWMEASRGPSIDGSGAVVAFASRHPIDALDRRDDYDLFVRLTEGSVRTEKH